MNLKLEQRAIYDGSEVIKVEVFERKMLVLTQCQKRLSMAIPKRLRLFAAIGKINRLLEKENHKTLPNIGVLSIIQLLNHIRIY